MDILKIIGIALISAVICMLVRKTHPEIAMQISIATGIIIFIFVLTYLEDVVTFISSLGNDYPYINDTIVLILKITGICYLCEFIVQILRDANENTTASKIEIAGKIVILAISLPVISTFLDMITEALV